MTDIEISEMTLADLEEIKDTLSEHFDDLWSYNVFKLELSNVFSKYVVAKQYGNIIGFAGMQIILDEGNIMNIVTKTENRKLGIASLMLTKLFEIAKKHKLRVVNLEVNEHNLAAIHLYNKFGFKQVGVRHKYYNHTDDALLMTSEFKNI